MGRCRFFYIVLPFLTGQAFSQISPPGLEETNAASWSAVGLRQQLSEHWAISFYLGVARKSAPDDFFLFRKPGIFVINQDATFQIAQKWSIAFCASYRRQNEYAEESPYQADYPAVKREERFYTRLYFRPTAGQTQFIFSLRPEFRLYYADHGHTWNPVYEEFRFRFKGQAVIRLNRSNSNQLILANEILTATDHVKSKSTDHWTSYAFMEDRLATFFRHKFSTVITADIGFMHQIKSDGKYIAHFSMDVIFNNVFSKRKS